MHGRIASWFEVSEIERDLAHSDPGDESATDAEEGTLSAGEAADAVDSSLLDQHHGTEVIIGEIPDAHDPIRLLWTARCSFAGHDLLGHFDTRAEAEQAGVEHLQRMH